VSIYLREASDVDRTIELLRLSYEIADRKRLNEPEKDRVQKLNDVGALNLRPR
jgi:hypothetical protein